MTVLEAKAECTAVALKANGCSQWRKDDADRAAKHAQKLLADGKIGAAEFVEVVAHVAGNHSARLQALKSWGFIEHKEADSAEKRQIQAALTALDKAEDEALKKLTQ